MLDERDALPEGVIARVNRAIDLIVTELDGPLPLERVASAACCSPFHFHRLFKRATGETLAAFVGRLRLERALGRLVRGPAATLTEIALDCGFNSASDFSRRFRARYGVAPSAFDLDAFRRERRGELEALFEDETLRARIAEPAMAENPDGFEVRLAALPARSVAYVRVQEPFRSGAPQAAAERLVRWAEARGCAGGVWLGYMWEDPEIVPLERCRYDVAVVLDDARDAGLRGEGEVGRFEFPAMQVAEIDVIGSIDVEQRALDYLYGPWLQASSMLPAELPCFEAWHGRPWANGDVHFELTVQLPVERA